jgi:hypothetical protein
VESIKGDKSLADGSGSAGPATITVNPYGYQSVGIDSLLEPTSKWIVEMYRGDSLIGSVSSDSANASASGRIGLPDGGGQYGNHIFWRQLIPTEEVKNGDRWVVYGWDGLPDAGAYPPDRYFQP